MWNMETHCFPGNCLVCPFHGSRLAGSIELLDPADPCPVTDKGAAACERSGGEQGGQAGIRESRMPCCPERFRLSDGVAPRPATTGHRVLPPFPADRGPWIPCETLIPDDPNCLLLRRATTVHHRTSTGKDGRRFLLGVLKGAAQLRRPPTTLQRRMPGAWPV